MRRTPDVPYDRESIRQRRLDLLTNEILFVVMIIFFVAALCLG